MKVGIEMGNEYIKEQIHHILKGKTIELVPVTKEHMDFLCDEESDSELWCYEEYVETNKERIRERFTKRIEENGVFDFIIKASSSMPLLTTLEGDLVLTKGTSFTQDLPPIEDRKIDAFQNIVKRSSDGAYMGAAYIWQCSETRKSWEIGYVVLPEFQGKGYCLESVKLLIAFAFNELNAHKVIGMCHCDNLKSASVMQKAEMLKQGVFREEYKCGDKWVDQFYFSILEREYRKNY